MKNKGFRIVLLVIMFILCSSLVLGASCVVSGQVSLSDGSPAPNSMNVFINVGGETSQTVTANNQNKDGFFIATFKSCKEGEEIRILVENDKYKGTTISSYWNSYQGEYNVLVTPKNENDLNLYDEFRKQANEHPEPSFHLTDNFIIHSTLLFMIFLLVLTIIFVIKTKQYKRPGK